MVELEDNWYESLSEPETIIRLGMLKNTHVTISSEKIKKIKRFAIESEPYHKDRFISRTPEQRRYSIFIGKLGEEIEYEIFKPYFNISPVSYEIKRDGKGDGGIDLSINDIKIDVKTIDKSHKTMRLIHELISDWYSLIVLDDSKTNEPTGGTFIGTLLKEEVLKYKEYNKQYDCEFVHKRYFEQLYSCYIKI